MYHSMRCNKAKEIFNGICPSRGDCHRQVPRSVLLPYSRRLPRRIASCSQGAGALEASPIPARIPCRLTVGGYISGWLLPILTVTATCTEDPGASNQPWASLTRCGFDSERATSNTILNLGSSEAGAHEPSARLEKSCKISFSLDFDFPFKSVCVCTS
jgi:hypothetical protein